MKKYTMFRPRVRTKNHTANDLRPDSQNLPLFPFKSVIRLGSTTTLRDDITSGGSRIECNTVQAVKNSSNKLVMKHLFNEFNINQAKGFILDGKVLKNMFTNETVNFGDEESIKFPLLAKKVYGSKARGMVKLDDKAAYDEFIQGQTNGYYFEEFKNYAREYRLHISKNGCFYTCRKVRKNESEIRWFFNNDTCNWLLETNENFDKPVNWDEIVKQSVNALKAVKLDVGAVDVRIQSAKTPKGKKRKDPSFIICEINSAPSFGEVTLTKYVEEIPKILNEKYEIFKG